MLDSACIFCKIITGNIPCHKIAETAHALAFLDIAPLTKSGHILVIPKFHAQKMHQVSDECLQATILLAKQIASACFPEKPYNLLQNNGREANQAVDHCHFHIIPRDADGLVMKWNTLQISQDELTKLREELTAKIK